MTVATISSESARKEERISESSKPGRVEQGKADRALNRLGRESKGKSKSSRRTGESNKKSDTASKEVSKRDDKKQPEKKDDAGIAALEKRNKSSAKDGENKSHSVSKQHRKTKSKRDAQSTKKEISKKEDDSGEKGEKKEKGGVRRRKKANKDSKEDIDSPSEEEVLVEIPEGLNVSTLAVLLPNPDGTMKLVPIADADKVSSDSDVDTISESETEGVIQKSINEE